MPKVTHTEFCQGRTMRWALAWSFYDDVIVPSPPSKKRKLEKAKKPLSFTLPEQGLKELMTKASALYSTVGSPVESVTVLLEKTLTDLKVLHKRVPCRKGEQSLLLTAVENTWIHMRQKRREGARQLRELPRALQSAGPTSQVPLVSAASTPAQASQKQCAQTQTTKEEKDPNNGAHVNELTKDAPQDPAGDQKEVSEVSGVDMDVESSTTTGAGKETGLKEVSAAAREHPCKQSPSTAAVDHFLFKCTLNVIPDQRDVMIEMHWIEGQNKDLMNQLCTYLKNTLLRSIALC